jgi:hypothetical protein
MACQRLFPSGSEVHRDAGPLAPRGRDPRNVINPGDDWLRTRRAASCSWTTCAMAAAPPRLTPTRRARSRLPIVAPTSWRNIEKGIQPDVFTLAQPQRVRTASTIAQVSVIPCARRGSNPRRFVLELFMEDDLAKSINADMMIPRVSARYLLWRRYLKPLLE